MSDNKIPDLTTIDSRTVYENRWMRVLEDKILRRDGSEGIYGYVEKPDFVVIAPIQDGLVHLVQQYRYPIRQRQWEFPQGSWETKPETTPEAIARAELAEETGLIANSLTQVGHLFPLYGTATQAFRIFYATGLTSGPRSLELEEQDLITRAFPLATVEAMILDGIIKDAATVAALSILRLHHLI